MTASSIPTKLTFKSATGSIGIEGGYAPTQAAALVGVVRVDFIASLSGTENDPADKLRATETHIAAEVLHRLNTYDSVVAERDKLLEKAGSKTIGFNATDMMFAEDASIHLGYGS
jgi:hypothetical protein